MKRSKNKTSRIKHRFLATNIIVLNMSHTADSSGEIIPPEAHINLENPVPILFEFDETTEIGDAYITRIGNRLVADLHMYSTDSKVDAALNIIKTLYPSVAYLKLDYHNNVTTKLEILCVSVGRHSNHDKTIKTLGNGVKLYSRKDELH